MTGRIRKESPKVQIAFIELMCQYWKNGCKMTSEQAELEVDCLPILLKKKLVKQDGKDILIQFLDEQMVDIEDISIERSNAAKERWKRYKQNNASSMQVHASALQINNSAMQSDADKIRQDKRREEYYPHASNAFTEIQSDNTAIETYIRQLRQAGFNAAGEFEVMTALKNFLSKQEVDKSYFEKRDKNEVKKHFGNWLEKQPFEKLIKLATNERFKAQVS